MGLVHPIPPWPETTRTRRAISTEANDLVVLAGDTRRGSYPAPLNPFGIFVPGTAENEAWVRGAGRLLGAARDAIGGGDNVLEMAPPAAPPQNAAPQTDSLGRTISPRATMPSPGDCTPGEHRRLQDEVNAVCKPSPPRCVPGMTPGELEANRLRNMACGDARDRLNSRCFAGGDLGHREQAIDKWNAAARCGGLMPP